MNTIEPLEARIAPATIIVTNNLDSGTGSLRAALALADDPVMHPGPDTIVFHFQPQYVVNGAVTIALTSGELMSKGNVSIIGPGAGKLILNAGGNSRGFAINDGNNTGSGAKDSPTLISGLSIINGKSSTSGGGIISTESLTLKGVLISGCVANVDGGGVYAGSSDYLTKVAISNSLIIGNSAGKAGGGLDLFSLKSLTMTGTSVMNNANTSTIYGAGGVYAGLNNKGTGMTISGCQISGNTADHGGGVFLTSYNKAATARMIISASNISGNTSTGKGQGGGGLYVEYGNAVVTRTAIVKNTAGYIGGGIEAKGFASLTISASTISGNVTTVETSGQGGAGAYIKGTGMSVLPVKIVGSRIDGNMTAIVGSNGGGVFATNGIALTISGSTISGNAAGSRGGAVFTSGGGAGKTNLTMTGCTIADNFARQAGGGILAAGDGSVSIAASKVTGNRTNEDNGGGIYAESTESVTLKNVVVTGNSSGNGGGVYVTGTPDFHMIGGSITGNSGLFGGGVYVTMTTGSIVGVTISGNVASGKGGGLCEIHADDDITLHLAKITGNTSLTGPNTYGMFTTV